MSEPKNNYDAKGKFNLRKFDKPIKKIVMPSQYIGFTNRILSQQIKNKLNIWIPVYVNFKIKSIQDIDIHKLVGSISCVLIIQIYVDHLPAQLVDFIYHNVTIQLNRTQIIKLSELQDEKPVGGQQKSKINFIIRKTFTTSIVQQTFWSPFQIIRLIVSITFNSIKAKGQNIFQKLKNYNKILYQPAINTQLQYNISFNCMRNNAEIPINYSLGCVYSVYDLAQNLLESYHTNLQSYTQVKRQYYHPKNNKDSKNQKKQLGKKSKQEYKQSQKIQINNRYFTSASFKEKFQIQQKKIFIHKPEIEDQQKPEYFQYTHLVIPLYKYPGNALATIFVPLFLLAILSLAIFFQQNDLSQRMGSIATMVLGYIALVPSIKQQLPPSDRITIIQRIIYISTLCCLLPLIQSYRVNNLQQHNFIWNHSIFFIVCLIIHTIVFLFVILLMIYHKFKWQPSYNRSKQVPKLKISDSRAEWTNIYCDQVFYRANSKIFQKNHEIQVKQDGNSPYLKPQKVKMMIKGYRPLKFKPSSLNQSKLSIESSQSPSKSIKQKQNKNILKQNSADEIINAGYHFIFNQQISQKSIKYKIN